MAEQYRKEDLFQTALDFYTAPPHVCAPVCWCSLKMTKEELIDLIDSRVKLVIEGAKEE